MKRCLVNHGSSALQTYCNTHVLLHCTVLTRARVSCGLIARWRLDLNKQYSSPVWAHLWCSYVIAIVCYTMQIDMITELTVYVSSCTVLQTLLIQVRLVRMVIFNQFTAKSTCVVSTPVAVTSATDSGVESRHTQVLYRMIVHRPVHHGLHLVTEPAVRRCSVAGHQDNAGVWVGIIR